MSRARILILWNQTEDDVVEHWRRDGRRSPDWDPSRVIEPWDTVAEEMELLSECVRTAGHDAVVVNIQDDFKNLLEAIEREKPDCILNLIEWYHDDFEHEHHVPALFELIGVEYTGNRPLSLSLCQKKPWAKALLQSVGLPVPRGVVVDVGIKPGPLDLKFPLIVKPAYEDASGGIDAGSVVADRAALDARIAHVHRENKMAALVEEFIEGREVHCAILGNDPPEALPLYEMKFKGGVDDLGRPLPKIITYKAKWDPYSRDYHAVESVCPPEDLAPELVAHIQDVAMRAYRVLGCRDYARVDMRVDPAGTPYILEVNPNPDLADGCAFAQSVRASGRTYQQAISQIVGYALDRARHGTGTVGPTDTLLREYLAQRRARRSTGG
jgi:D-alanine-D-alanine ligase